MKGKDPTKGHHTPQNSSESEKKRKNATTKNETLKLPKRKLQTYSISQEVRKYCKLTDSVIKSTKL